MDFSADREKRGIWESMLQFREVSGQNLVSENYLLSMFIVWGNASILWHSISIIFVCCIPGTHHVVLLQFITAIFEHFVVIMLDVCNLLLNHGHMMCVQQASYLLT